MRLNCFLLFLKYWIILDIFIWFDIKYKLSLVNFKGEKLSVIEVVNCYHEYYYLLMK